MGVNRTEQVQVVTSQTTLDPLQGVTQMALFDQDGTPVDFGVLHQAAAVVNIATIDAIDPATTMALANINKAKINELLTALRTAGIIHV